MLEVVEFDDIVKGDIILITGWEDEDINVVTVGEILKEDLLIVPEEMGGLDYSPSDIRSIVRIGNNTTYSRICLLAKHQHEGSTLLLGKGVKS